MKQMISELVVNEEVVSFFFVSETPLAKKSKRGKEYLCLKLQDKTGVVDGRVWGYPAGFDPTTVVRGSFLKVKAQVSEWQDVLQLQIGQIRLVLESDGIDLGDFFERSEIPPEELYEELHELLLYSGAMPDEFLMKITRGLLENNKEKLLLAPAGKSVHHAYIGGLLTHVLSMCQVAIPICKHYGLNQSLVLAACVAHDIGKIWELDFPVGISYTVQGTLLGHITIGMEMVSRQADTVGCPQKTKMALMHLVASHHSLLAYGSPKIPMMREALIFALIDQMDAKNAICDKAVKKGVDAVGMTEFVRELEGPLYVFKEDE